MGYTLKIGECRLDYDEDSVRVDCDLTKRDDAPAHGEPTDRENQRWPSYSKWAEAMEALDLMDVMFNSRNGGRGEFEWNGKHRSPLLETHPGATPITVEHVQFVEAKLAAYKAANPDHIAKYPPPKPGAKPIFEGSDMYREEDLVKDPRFDSSLVRGEWLAYWLRWSIENCKQPVFVNS